MPEYFKVYDADDRIPESSCSVLAYVEDPSSESAPCWTIAQFNGANWIYEVANLSQVTLPRSATVTHWASLPVKPPVDRGYRSVADLAVPQFPTVRYNSKHKTVEIFGKPSPYTEKSPYTLDHSHYKNTTEALDTLAHLGGKKWGVGATFLREVAKAICCAMDDLPSGIQ